MESQSATELFQQGFGDPRHLPDSCVEYMLFILDDRLDPHDLLASLEKVRKAAIELCASTTRHYIWQRDSFQLQVQREHGLVYLHGTTDYGDSVEDEWLIVYLLRQLTIDFPTLWVRVCDGGGEFLLVEAANVLPRWLSPEIDANRVWMYQGGLQLLPLAASAGVKRPLTLAEATHYASDQPSSVLHSPFIEAEAFYRLQKYPGQIKACIHQALVTLPRKLAYILHEQPAAIAPAVEAFYLRDPTALKPIRAANPDLHFPPTDLVTVSVKFTQLLFAQVRSQNFSPPPSWSSLVKSGEDADKASVPDLERNVEARLELGMKITSGFEMLALGADKTDNRLAREFAILLQDVEEDGPGALPSDREMAEWPDVAKEDDDGWLDINFEDFETELEGKEAKRRVEDGGFGDQKTQADLRKMVSRFEEFLNDETADPEGAEPDDMDQDNNTSDEEEDSSEDEDKAVSFDEDQFNRMMREMMGLPAESTKMSADDKVQGKSESADSELAKQDVDDEEEEEEIRQLAAQMEAELKGLGALKLDATPETSNALEAGKGEVEESVDDEVAIDYNLVKNLLESFKGQAGMAGPAGNMLGMMGIQLPRDEDEDEDEDEGEMFRKG
ncbi:SGT1-domain-containing protein [Xylariaceae sp. FL1019]|nr:SGT1-domain-containing protein [Xylariaceae sp. FL1019]